jgi:dihydrodipicolinate synthase/N-acetylneuraminate lyase
MKLNWSGVYSAVSNQFIEYFSINFSDNAAMCENLIKEGANGIIANGTTATLVQSIKLARQFAGRSSKRIRASRIPLIGLAREQVAKRYQAAMCNRIVLTEFGL